MSEFFRVKDPQEVFEFFPQFKVCPTESVSLRQAGGRVLPADYQAVFDLPPFDRSVVDGYAMKAESSFGASEAMPVYLELVETIEMGYAPKKVLKPGQTSYVPTGGMLPQGADAVVMVENSGKLNENMVEIYKSAGPYTNMVRKGEDFKKDTPLLTKGDVLRSQDLGLLAAFGTASLSVYGKPRVGIISTGDELRESNDWDLPPGTIYDINSYTLGDMVLKAGGEPDWRGVVADGFANLQETAWNALQECDVVLISGGSSVGPRDYTLEVLKALPKSEILLHGIAVSPGKPTILANCYGKAVWGLPGHVASAMVIFGRFVTPFLAYIGGRRPPYEDVNLAQARLSRNVASAQGREDYIRAHIKRNDRGELMAEPILGKSSLLNTMIHADGLIKIDKNLEGVKAGEMVQVILF